MALDYLGVSEAMALDYLGVALDYLGVSGHGIRLPRSDRSEWPWH